MVQKSQTGVDLVDARGGDLSGPRSSARGYSYSSPSGSNTVIAAGTAHLAVKDVFTLDGSVTDARKKLIDFDPDLLASTDSTLSVVIVDIKQAAFDQADYDNMSAFSSLGIAAGAAGTTDILACLDNISGIAFTGYSTTSQVRRLTRRVLAANAATSVDAVRLFLVGTGTFTAGTTGASGLTIAAGNLQFPQTDDLTEGGALGSVVGQAVWGLEGNADIPEIDIKVDSIAVTAQTKKLKAKWTPELGQDLNAYHNLDAEVELTSLLSEQIALEIDREILADLVNGATAGTRYWSRAPGLFVDSNGNEIGASSAAPDFTGTVSEWYETLVETINDVSAQIHRKTLRGGANFVVCGPEVANILEFTAGFRAAVTHDDEKGSIGALKTGSLSKKFDVIVDPYFLRNVILIGRRGSSFLESGYVYAPYVPLQTTPTIFGPEDFVPRKGVMTRYAKKMVRPDMYGLVVVRGLLGESGAS